MIQDQELRLKCLELAVSKTPDFNEQIGRAKKYVEYVLGSADKAAEEHKHLQGAAPQKKQDNSRILA